MLNAKDAMHSRPNSTLRLETGVLDGDASSSASRTPVPESNASTSTASTIPS